MVIEGNNLQPLTRTTLSSALRTLCQKDPMLRLLAKEFGSPPLWQRPQNFDTLVHLVMEQKVSLISAKAVMQRVRLLCPGMDPTQFLTVPVDALRNAGVSASKCSYCCSIAQALNSGDLNLAGLRRRHNDAVIEQLTAVRGIGPWTAGVYLLMAMRRPDAWASGDRALVVSLAESDGLSEVPGYAKFDQYAERWRPHRATAARMLWHAYLCRRRK